MFTNADNFTIDFPMEYDVKIKATLIAALFLIVSNVKLYIEKNYNLKNLFKDFMFFEQKNNEN